MGEAARPSLKLRRVRYAQSLDRINKIPEPSEANRSIAEIAEGKQTNAVSPEGE